MFTEKRERRLGLILALLSVVAILGLAHMASADATGTGGEDVSYGSSLLPYGGVTVPWDELTDGASYYVIQGGDVRISFEGHDATGVEVMLAGSGLNTDYHESVIHGELEGTVTFSIDGRAVTLVMVPGVGYDLPIYGARTEKQFPSPTSVTFYVGEYKSYSWSISASDFKYISTSDISSGFGVSENGLQYSYSDSTLKLYGTPTKAFRTGAYADFGSTSLGTRYTGLTVNSLYKVTFNANGGSCGTSYKGFLDDSDSVILPSATRTDYNFLGWYTAASGGTYVGTVNDDMFALYSPTKSVTLYAHWEQTNEPVTSIDITGSDSVKKGESTTLTAISNPSKASDRHVNWTVTSGSSYITLGGTTDTTSGGTVTVTGKAVGTATVKATARDGSGVTATFTITVTEDPVTHSYTLRYDADGGSGAPTSFSDTSTDTYYDTTVSTKKPAKSGYTFLGWSMYSGDDTVDYEPGESIRLTPGTTTLYAVWKQMTEYWYLYFDASGGTGAPSRQSVLVEDGASSVSVAISSTAPTRSGYDFAGWSKTNGSTTAAYQPGGRITLTSSSTTLYAVWEEVATVNTFILEFDTVGGAGGPGRISVSDTTASKTTNIPDGRPVKQGYNFAGWGESSGTGTVRYQPGDSITLSPGTKVLYAVWTQDSYVLLLDTAGGTPSGWTLTGSGSAGGYTFTIPSDHIPTRSGHIFAGWAESMGGAVKVSPGGTYHVESSGTLYAVWTEVAEKVTYTLRYDVSPGTGGPEDATVEVDEGRTATITITDTVPKRSGYSFRGWSDVYGSENPLYGSGETITLTSTTTTLYAVWAMQPVTFTLSYVGNFSGASGVPSKQTVSVAATSYTFTVSDQIPTVSGRLFLGWSKSADASVASYAPGSTITVSKGTTTLYGVWVLEKKMWTLEYDTNGGEGGPGTVMEEASGISHGFVIPDDAPTKEGYTFVGWSSSGGSQTANLYAGDVFTTSQQSSRLYAVWAVDTSDRFVLCFDANGGTGAPVTMTGSGRGTYTMTVPDTVPVWTGHVFKGWSKTADGDVQYQPGDGILFTSPGQIDLYAVWEETVVREVTYILNFDANGGTGAPAQMRGTSDTGVYVFDIPWDIPARDGHTFAGWSTQRDGRAMYDAGGNYHMMGALDAEATLYAVWRDASAPVEEPVAVIKIKVDGFTIRYDATGSVDHGRVSWDFGDGQRSLLESGSHTYSEAGEYTVTLTVWNGTLSDTVSQTVAVDGSSSDDGSASGTLRAAVLLIVIGLLALVVVLRLSGLL